MLWPLCAGGTVITAAWVYDYSQSVILSILSSLIPLFSTMALVVKRLHDLNLSVLKAFWQQLLALLITGIMWLVGTMLPNQSERLAEIISLSLIASLVIFIVLSGYRFLSLFLERGTAGDNAYGSDPAYDASKDPLYFFGCFALFFFCLFFIFTNLFRIGDSGNFP